MPKMEKLRISNRRYLGSKTKLLHFIHETIKKEKIVFESVMDLFAGTGVVASSFNDSKTKVILNDILECNRCAHNAFFGNENIDVDKLDHIIQKYNDTIVTEDNYFSINFSDTFFSSSNCKKIGWIRDDIDDLFENKKINKREKDYLITSLIYSIDRIANTVGHYDAYRKNGELNKDLILYLLDVFDCDTNSNNIIYSEDSNELVKKISCDLVYIDPPYNSRQYCDAYHLLENIASWKKPKVYGVARKMDRNGLKSRYCENSAPRVFDELIKCLDCKFIIVSYNNMGLKGVGRSQAKISDVEIIRSLEQRGKVTIYETDFNQFTTGKSVIEDHKERLFVCKVGKFDKPEKVEIGELVKSPLNYTGGKFKILKQLQSRFPKNINTFVDLFGGGFNVGANINAKTIIYNDISEQTTRLIKLFYKYNSNEIIQKLENLIKKYGLSDSQKNGYAFYKCTSNNGLGSYNKKQFLELRKDYNASKKSIEKDFLLLLLTIYSFNNQIRFNSDGHYNLPVGKRDLNASTRKNIKLFAEKLKTKNIIFLSEDFLSIKPSNYSDPFFYCDPPYLLGDASYNENGGWDITKEIMLLAYLRKLSEKGIKFALSNVLEHKGNNNETLISWAMENKYNIIYLDNNYANSNYQSKAKDNNTVEVLITNF